MLYRVLADVVVVVHLAFVAFVAVGGFVAWRWPRALGAHLAAVAWGAGIVVVGWDCPLTAVERWARRRGGETVDGAGFVDRYLEGVLYPGDLTSHLRVVVAVAIATSWWVLWRRRRRLEAARSVRCAGGGDHEGGLGVEELTPVVGGPQLVEPLHDVIGAEVGVSSVLPSAAVPSTTRARRSTDPVARIAPAPRVEHPTPRRPAPRRAGELAVDGEPRH